MSGKAIPTRWLNREYKCISIRMHIYAIYMYFNIGDDLHFLFTYFFPGCVLNQLI